MSTIRTSSGAALTGLEPSLEVQVLRACPGCGQVHPMARGLDTHQCPDCGTNCPVGEHRSVPAAITGWTPWAIAARLSLWLGRCLAALARSI